MTKKQQNQESNYTEELESKVAELTHGWQRTQADFANFKRQTEQDRANLIRSANVELILDILPVLDNFQLAAKHVPIEIENNNWVIGIKQVEKQLESILQNAGLIRISTLGQQFDHNLHEAIESVASDKLEHEIIEELQAGYIYNDSVIRPAKVKVSNGQK